MVRGARASCHKTVAERQTASSAFRGCVCHDKCNSSDTLCGNKSNKASKHATQMQLMARRCKHPEGVGHRRKLPVFIFMQANVVDDAFHSWLPSLLLPPPPCAGNWSGLATATATETQQIAWAVRAQVNATRNRLLCETRLQRSKTFGSCRAHKQKQLQSARKKRGEGEEGNAEEDQENLRSYKSKLRNKDTNSICAS